MALADMAVGAGQVIDLLRQRKLAEYQAYLEQQERDRRAQLDQGRLDLDRQRVGQDASQFDARLGLDRDKLGVEQQQFEANAPERDARAGFIRTQTKDLEQKPLYAEADRQADEAKAKTQHGYRLREIAAQGALRTPAQERIVQVEGPDGKAVWVRESDAVGRPAAQAARAITGAERKELGFFQRMLDAERNARKVENDVSAWDIGVSDWSPAFIENWLKSDAGKRYTQAQRMFTEGRLRADSGAAVPANEYTMDRQTNFRIGNDDEATIKQKRASRLTAMRGQANRSGRALQEYYGEGETLDSLLKEFEEGGGLVPMVAPDGRRLQVPPDKVAEMEAHGAKRQ